MADGHIILVEVGHKSGGKGFRVIYIVNEANPGKAREIVQAHMDPNVLTKRIEAWGSLPEVAVNALNLQPGEFAHFYG